MRLISIFFATASIYYIYLLRVANNMNLGKVELFDIQPMICHLKRLLLKNVFALKVIILFSFIIYHKSKQVSMYTTYKMVSLYRHTTGYFEKMDEKKELYKDMNSDMVGVLAKSEAEKLNYYTGLPIEVSRSLKNLAKDFLKLKKEKAKHLHSTKITELYIMIGVLVGGGILMAVFKYLVI